MTPRTAIVLQARMGSARLPGKSLAVVAGRSLLAHCIERLRFRSGLPVIVATTTDPEDAAIEREAAALGSPVVRGPSLDVLHRYLMTAEQFDLLHIVRATADNPAVDMDAPLRTVGHLLRTGADHVIEDGLPVGAAVEAMTVDALRRANRLAGNPYDREHVTPYLRRGPGMRAIVERAPAPLTAPGLRLTVDTADDLARLCRIHARLGPRTLPAPLTDIMAAALQVEAEDAPCVEVVTR